MVVKNIKKGVIVYISVTIITLIICSVIGVLIMPKIVKVYDNMEMDPLLWAINSGEAEYVEEALREGADVNRTSSYDITQDGLHVNNPLRLAIDYGSDEMCELLIDYGADVNYIDANQHSLLMCAAYSCEYNKVKMLIDAGVDVNYITPESSDENVNYINPNGEDAMTYAIISDSNLRWYDDEKAFQIIKLLLEHGLKIDYSTFDLVNSTGGEVIRCMKLMDYLIPDYYLPEYIKDSKKNSILVDIYLGNTETVSKYIDKCVKNKDVPFYVIAASVANDNIEVLDYYYRKGFDLEINSGYAYEQTLLMVAAAFDSYDSAKFLLEHGADINQKSEVLEEQGYMTARLYAEKYNSQRVIELFDETENN